MKGEDLYDLWADALEGQAAEVDEWTDLPEPDRDAWREVAARVEVIE